MSSLPTFADLFHTGIVVDDVESAKDELSQLLGIAWGSEGEVDMPVWFPDGGRTVSFKFAYTAEGPHHLELVRSIPGTLWTVNGVGHAHHLGFWSTDVAAASAELTRRDLPLRAKVGVDDADAQAPIVLHQADTGVYIELLDVSTRSMLFGETT